MTLGKLRHYWRLAAAIGAVWFVASTLRSLVTLWDARDVCSRTGAAARLCTVAHEARFGRSAESLLVGGLIGLAVIGACHLLILRSERDTVGIPSQHGEGDEASAEAG